ncbi:MAG: hypothetical protein K0S33_675 [Bacteroidetes bacterium]|jgi:hypothetical protein|nr:hypothetical protein [Bacteroidota bacterium]
MPHSIPIDKSYIPYQMEPKRACVYSKDVQRITGKSERYSRDLLSKIRKALNKSTDQFITVEEFCKYTGLTLETVEKYLID